MKAVLLFALIGLIAVASATKPDDTVAACTESFDVDTSSSWRAMSHSDGNSAPPYYCIRLDGNHFPDIVDGTGEKWLFTCSDTTANPVDLSNFGGATPEAYIHYYADGGDGNYRATMTGEIVGGLKDGSADGFLDGSEVVCEVFFQWWDGSKDGDNAKWDLGSESSGFLDCKNVADDSKSQRIALKLSGKSGRFYKAAHRSLDSPIGPSDVDGWLKNPALPGAPGAQDFLLALEGCQGPPPENPCPPVDFTGKRRYMVLKPRAKACPHNTCG